MSLFSFDGINFHEASTFLSISSLHQRNRDRHDHHDGTATVEHCDLWAEAKMDVNFEPYAQAMRKVCGANESSLFATFNYFQFSRK